MIKANREESHIMILEGKKALVTEGSCGIGKTISKELARQGADVAITYNTNESKVLETIDELKDLGASSTAYQLNMLDKGKIQNVLEEFVNNYGKIDIFINSAGIAFAKPLEEMTVEEWDRVFNTNLKGPFLMSQMVANYMISQKQGTIIYLSSLLGVYALPFCSAHSAAKGGLIMMAKVQGVEWAKYNVRVNAIVHSFIQADLLEDKINKEFMSEELLKGRTPLERIVSPDEIANVAAFLASDKASYFTGTTVFVDGGWTAYCGC
jgi:NAD(P)-dependent dehydrogenase (short-subunit alcohol dehydrogenase family)